MKSRIQCNEKKILCECGHPLIWHSFGEYQCNASTRRTERKKNELGKYIKVKCCYVCYCKEFKKREDKNVS